MWLPPDEDHPQEVAGESARGGGEFGKACHDAGWLANKQNVFDDFAAAGEFLKANDYTTKDGLGIEGRSNGGLSIGLPDPWPQRCPPWASWICCASTGSPPGDTWIDDYGSPEKEQDFRLLRAYSPYHNIAGGKDYPAILVSTADTDDRVVPAHSFKYAVALQATDIGDKPHLIRVDTRSGLGSGKSIDKLIDEYADS